MPFGLGTRVSAPWGMLTVSIVERETVLTSVSGSVLKRHGGVLLDDCRPAVVAHGEKARSHWSSRNDLKMFVVGIELV